ncbi:hypothetical protein Tco_0682529 [Tanacetum coccineum]|uniref:Uncharacterized protein n=1 Tax=Tanacetum coccineum TaxID=301880 RepID=A0ABQ4XRP5_9ASTR
MTCHCTITSRSLSFGVLLRASNEGRHDSINNVINAIVEVAFDLLRDALSAIFGLSELKDPYEEAARQLLEQAPHSPEYVPADHVPVYIPEPEHPEDLVPAEDETPNLTTTSFLAPDSTS